MDRDKKAKLAKDMKTAHQVFQIFNAMYSIENLAQDWKKLRENIWEKFLMCSTIAGVLAVFGVLMWIWG